MNTHRWRKSLPSLCLGLTLLTLAPAHAALTAYLSVKDPGGALIQGSVTQRGREGKIAVIAFDHEIKAAAADTAPTFDLILTGSDPTKQIDVIRIVREVARLGLTEAKALVESAPKPLKQRVSRKEAEQAKTQVDRSGGTTEIRQASAAAGGRRQHGLFTITKEEDKSTNLLYAAMLQNQTLGDWELQCWRPGPTGQEQQHYTVKLKNAMVVGVRRITPNVKDPALARLDTYEEVSFSYESIEWIWNDGGIVAGDTRQ
jgi:type VI secretion system secreted protein Hcp